MIGENMLIYDREHGRFFAKWYGKNHVPVWSEYSSGGQVFHRVSEAYAVKEQIVGARIVSEAEAKKIDTLKRKEAEQ